jgi:hypothetical protein
MAQTSPRVRVVSYIPIPCVKSFAASNGPRTLQGQAGDLSSPCMCTFFFSHFNHLMILQLYFVLLLNIKPLIC